MGKASWSVIDHDSEGSTIGVRIVDLDAGNIAAQLTAIGLLEDAIEGITTGGLTKLDVLAVTTILAGTVPSDGYSQRETKWLCSGTDSAGFRTTIEIPTADLDLLPSGSGSLNLAAGAGATFKTALEAVWRSKQGNPVTLDSVVHVGRNI